jgi:hypothetical protein
MDTAASFEWPVNDHVGGAGACGVSHAKPARIRAERQMDGMVAAMSQLDAGHTDCGTELCCGMRRRF